MRIFLLAVMIASFHWMQATNCLGSGLIEPTRTLEGGKNEPGKLSIFSEPPGLNVILDGKAVGLTPVHIEAVDEGPHDLRIKDKEAAIMIAPGVTLRLSFFKGEFIEIPVKKDKPSEEIQASSERTAQRAGSEQTTEESEKFEPGFFPLKPGGPIY